MKFFLLVLSYIVLLSGCRNTQSDSASSAYMVDLLEKIAGQNHTYRNPYMHEVRIAYFDSLRQHATGAEEKLNYHYQQAVELLNAGQSVAAVASFADLYQELLLYQNDFPDQVNPLLREVESLIAISYLRQGEQENCLLNHTSASCIVPIAAAGYHRLEEGSTRAIDTYTRILEKNDSALDARWLLNVAYMTLGGYPEQVPKPWLIPPAALASEYPLKKFEDVAPHLGLATPALSGGTVVEDFNGDGFLDVMVTSWGLQDQMQYFQNNGDGSFSERTQEAGLLGLVSGLNMVHTDYNNDGHPDVFVLRGAWLGEHGRHPNSLLRNNGPGIDGVPTFTDVTQAVGLLEFMPTQTATWSDFNNDGWVDLFIGNETPLGKFYKFPTRLYLNRKGNFSEVTQEAGLALTEYVKGVTSGDYDNDGWADLYVSTLEGPNFLFRNQGPDEEGVPRFQEVTEEAGLLEDIKTFPTWFWDYNNDGWLDIFVSGYHRGTAGSIAHQVAAEYLGLPFEANTPRLYRNNGYDASSYSAAGRPTFTDVTKEANLYRIMHTMGSNFGDLDNDGYLDMFLGTGDPDFRSLVPTLAFRNADGASFQNVTTAGGFGNLQKGHAVAFADLDNDGDQDIFVNMGGANYGDVYQNSLFENPYGNASDANHWIALQLEGRQSNRMAIGARIKLAITEEGKKRYIFREVNAGGSFGDNPLRQEIGLGKSVQVDTLVLTWPASGQVQTFTNIPADQFLRIVEGSDGIIRAVAKPVVATTDPHRLSVH